MKITFVGLSSVGFAQALVFAQRHEVVIFDKQLQRVEQINAGRAPLEPAELDDFIRSHELNIHATQDAKQAFANADFIVLTHSTKSIESSHTLDTQALEQALAQAVMANPQATCVIQARVPVGFTRRMQAQLNHAAMMIVPSFADPAQPLAGILHPLRLIVGGQGEAAQQYAQLCLYHTERDKVPVMFTESDEAESIQLFSPEYMTVRRLFRRARALTRDQVFDSVKRLSPMIKFNIDDSPVDNTVKSMVRVERPQAKPFMKTLLDTQALIQHHLVEKIMVRRPVVVGFYRLFLKSDKQADTNQVYAAYMHGVLKRLQQRNIKVLVYEPDLNQARFFSAEVVPELDMFTACSDLVLVANAEALDADAAIAGKLMVLDQL